MDLVDLFYAYNYIINSNFLLFKYFNTPLTISFVFRYRGPSHLILIFLHVSKI